MNAVLSGDDEGIMLSTDGYVAAGYHSGTVRLYKVDTGGEVGVVQQYGRAMYGMKFLPKPSPGEMPLLASWSGNMPVSLWQYPPLKRVGRERRGGQCLPKGAEEIAFQFTHVVHDHFPFFIGVGAVEFRDDRRLHFERDVHLGMNIT